MNHRAAKFFSSGLTAGPAQGDIVCSPVVLRDDGMVDGDVCGSLLEVADRIAASYHDIAEEVIGFSDCSSGRVDEAGLNAAPLVDVSGALGWR